MKNFVPGWTTISEQPPVLIKEYAFGPGKANAMAVGLPGGKWLIMSPPRHLSESEVEAFTRVGPVVALVENNGSHHMGLGPCQKVFPGATTYAAPRAAARIRKKGKDYGELAPVDQLTPVLGDQVELVPIAGDKIGDVVMLVRSERGTVFYASDFIANISKLPPSFLPRMIFRLSDSAPGLKVFKLFFRIFVADPKAARRALVEVLTRHAPTILVPAHGDVVKRDDLTPTLIGMLS